MPKTKERNDVEFYRGKLRESNKKIRQLERKVKELERHAHIYIKDQDEELATDSEDTFPNLHKNLCKECGKGKLDTIELLGRIFQTCQVCGDRKKIGG